jgi:antitoxin (DNA-binding transcriptional repressor) of toxin-antitoxin stability system
MKIVGIQEAKTKPSRLIEKACMGEEVIITSGKDRRVRLVPIRTRSGRRRFGALRGKLLVGRKFFEPLPPEELASWES